MKSAISPLRTFSLLLTCASLALVLAWLFSGDQSSRAAQASPPGSVRFAVIGDYGQEGPAESDVADLVHSWSPDFVVTVGDNSYYVVTDTQTITQAIDDNIGQYYQDYIFPYNGIYGPGAPFNKFWPSMGNHDWSGSSNPHPYVDYFTLPNNERYYDIVQGPVQFFMLDSDNREPDGNTMTSTQGIWLQNRLAASTAPWKLVILHHTPYSSIAATLGMRWPYEQWGASAVLAGHIHCYERFDFGGFPYFVDGLGGAGITPANFNNPAPGSVVRYKADYGAMLVEADANSITYQFYARTGALIDSYSMGAPTATATNISTNTAIPTATRTSTITPTSTNTASRTATPTSTSTSTATSSPISTRTWTPTATNSATNTATATSTPVPPTPTITFTPLPTQTIGGPTATPQPANTQTSTPSRTATHTPAPISTRTSTPAPSPTNTNIAPPSSPTILSSPTSGAPSATTSATACSLAFNDVLPGSTFYSFVRCLACRGIIGGYPCGGVGEPCPGIYYRPGNNVTRGQTSKIIAGSAGFVEPVPAGRQTFEDVPPDTTFYLYVERLSGRGIVGGYPCGGVGEPCGPGSRPYFRPNSNVTRGQLSKIVSGAAGWSETPPGQTFEDVPPDTTFYLYVERVAGHGVVSGYPCGGVGEPCLPPNSRPYFRPGNNASRGQMSKIAAGAFFPDCQVAAP